MQKYCRKLQLISGRTQGRLVYLLLLHLKVCFNGSNATRPNSQISPTPPSSVFVSSPPIIRVAANTFIVWRGITFSRKISSCRWWLYIPSMGFYLNHHLSRGCLWCKLQVRAFGFCLLPYGESAFIQLITGWYIGFLEDEKERRQSNCGRCFVTNLQFQPQAALRWLCAIVMQTFWLGEFITDKHITLKHRFALVAAGTSAWDIFLFSTYSLIRGLLDYSCTSY